VHDNDGEKNRQTGGPHHVNPNPQTKPTPSRIRKTISHGQMKVEIEAQPSRHSLWVQNPPFAGGDMAPSPDYPCYDWLNELLDVEKFEAFEY